jgi:hypothetical protein
MLPEERFPVSRVLGVRLTRSSGVWLNVPLLVATSLLLALPWPNRDRRGRLVDMAGFGLALTVTNAVHAVGHIISSRLIGAPMDELYITTPRLFTLYHGDQNSLPGRVHVGRAIGGTLANLALALLLLPLAGRLAPGPARRLVWQLLLVNLCFGLASWTPYPGVDGEILWREARAGLARRSDWS